MNKSMGVQSALIGVAFFLCAGAIGVDPKVLFERPGVPVRDYNVIVARIQPGDLLQFSNLRVWKVERELGKAQSSYLFASEGHAIRIARYAGQYDKDSTYQDLLNEIVDGNQILRDRLVPVVEVDAELSLRGEYVVQELLRPARGLRRLISLEDFSDGSVVLSQRVSRRLTLELIDFAVHCSGFRRFGDQSAKQILYNINRLASCRLS